MEIKWDYKKDDYIPYFDIEKSYELTGYRPINEKDGLDFNPDWFREAAIKKQQTGKYSGALFGSKAYKEFWLAEKDKCTFGHTVKGYRLTPDNYFFLNYYNLKTSEGESVNQTFGFPKFFVFQYEYFHYLEMCELLKRDVAVIKSRGIGWSEIASSCCVRAYTFIPNYRIVVSAFSKKHLDPTLNKIWYQMDWLNENTEGAFKRVRMNINTKTHKRASKKNKDLSEWGHMSEVEGIIVDDPDKLRGDRIQKLIYEEAGVDSKLIKKWIKGEALITTLGSKRVGMRIAFGTGGSSEGDSMQGLKQMVTTPQAYNVLPFRHNFTFDGSYKVTGYFIPCYRIVFPLVDKRGYCNRADSIAYFNVEREKKADDPKNLMDYQSEFCYTIEEALLKKDSAFFPREELAEQLTSLEVYKTVEQPERGFLVWERDNKGEKTGKVSWRSDNRGNILIKEHPLKTEDGVFYNNLYVGGIDSIDLGSKDSATQDEKKLSKFCIVIKKRMLGLEDPSYVAMYLERPKDPRDAYETAAKLLIYYNARAVLESTRTSIISFYRERKWESLLMKRPRATIGSGKTNPNMIGSPSTVAIIEHARELIYNFCLDYSHTINFIEMLNQLLNYSDEAKKEFDIVAAMQQCELADEEITFKKPKESENTTQQILNIGYWTDELGYKHYGVIPTNKNARPRIREEDKWLYNVSL